MNEHYLEPLKSELRNYLRKESIWDAGYMYLADRDFDLAENHFRDCLKEKPKEAMIWLGLAMAIEQVCNEADLSLSIHPLKENKNFRWALQYAEGSLRVRLEAYLKQNEQRIQAEGEAQKVKEAHILETEETAKIEVEKKRIKEEEEKKTEEVICEEYPTVGNDFEWEIMPDGTARVQKYVGLEYRGKEILIPSFWRGNPVTSIGDAAFYNCEYLTKITIPDSVTTIGYRAFYGCESLEEVAISDSITSIGDEAFYGCASLTKVTIPEGVTAIGDSTFWGCRSLVEVTIPKSVTSIGNWAFLDCKSLMSATIPENVTSIASHAFSYCNNLSIYGITGSYVDIYAKEHNIPFTDPTEEVDWEGIIKKLDARIKELEEAEEEEEEEKAEKTPFEYKILEDGSAEITGFKGNQTEITIPAQLDGHTVTSIGDFAFCGRSSLTSVTIPNSVTSINGWAFSGCGLIEVTILEGVTSIGAYAFSECSRLACVTLPDSITSIGEKAFYECSSLTSVSIPDSVTNIGEMVFSYCSCLTSVTIPDGVKTIDESAFWECSKNLTIHGKAYSAAAAYAREKSIRFVAH